MTLVLKPPGQNPKQVSQGGTTLCGDSESWGNMQLCARRWKLFGSKTPKAAKSASHGLPPAYHVRSVVTKAVATPNRLSRKAFQEPQLALVVLPRKAGYYRVTAGLRRV